MIVRTAFWFGVVGAVAFLAAWPLGLIPLLVAPLPGNAGTTLVEVVRYLPVAVSWLLVALLGFAYFAVPGFAWGTYRAWRERRRFWYDSTDRDGAGALPEGAGVWAVVIGALAGTALALVVSLSGPIPDVASGVPLPLLAVGGIVDDWPALLACAVLGGLLGHFAVKWVRAVWRVEDNHENHG